MSENNLREETHIPSFTFVSLSLSLTHTLSLSHSLLTYILSYALSSSPLHSLPLPRAWRGCSSLFHCQILGRERKCVCVCAFACVFVWLCEERENSFLVFYLSHTYSHSLPSHSPISRREELYMANKSFNFTILDGNTRVLHKSHVHEPCLYVCECVRKQWNVRVVWRKWISYTSTSRTYTLYIYKWILTCRARERKSFQ